MGRASRNLLSRVAQASIALGVVIALVAGVLFVRPPAAVAHHAEVSPDTQLLCTDDGLAVYWVAQTWTYASDKGLHPLIHVDMRTDITAWVEVGSGAFTNENGRMFDGTTPVPDGATFVEIRVRPDANEVWGGGSNVRGGSRTLGISVGGEYQNCGTTEPPFPEAGLGDRVWLDTNDNAAQDEGEQGVAGVRVVLWTDDDGDTTPDTMLAETVTDDQGVYGFDGLDPDLVYLVEFDAADVGDLVDVDAGDDQIDSDADQLSGFTGLIDLDPGEFDMSIDAGVIPKVCGIGDYVWLDADEDGIQDPDEQGVAEVTVNLWLDEDADGVPDVALAATTTDAVGAYLFVELPCRRTYIVEFVAPDGFEFTTPDAGGDDVDSDAGSGGLTGPIFPTGARVDPTIDAGLVPTPLEPASLGDTVWFDTDGDGVQDDGEPGVAGVVVNLWVDTDGDDAPDDQIATTTTDDGGLYGFTGLDPAATYVVEFEAPDGRSFTVRDAGDDAADSDPDPATGITGPIDLEPGENDPTIDAGLVETPPDLASIGDTVWFDADGDGVQDDGEPGVAGVTVNLWVDTDGDDAPDSQVSTTTTDAAGEYGFADLDPDQTHVVEFVAPPGSDFTLRDVGNDATDSDADPATGITGPIDLDPGENDPTIDAGLVDTPVPLASLGDKVWRDADGDGVQDDSESGVAGVTVVLWTAVDGAPGAIVAQTETDADGMYGFGDLDPGVDYIVAFQVPAELGTLTDRDVGADDTVDSDADPATGRSGVIDLDPGENDPTIDAGVVPVPCALGDRVWLDGDADGIQDPGELGVGGVVVRVWLDTDGDGSPDEVVAETVTESDGFYDVAVPCGEALIVEFVAPDGRDFSENDRGDDDAVDSDPDPATGLTTVIVVSDGATDPTVDAGIIGLRAEIDVEKSTNGVDADVPEDAPVVAEGESVVWEYVVTNTGSVDLVDVVVTDDIEGLVCEIAALAAGASTTCELTGSATAGQYRNVATATGDPVDDEGEPVVDIDGLPVPAPVDEDPSGYTGLEAEVLGLEVRCASSGVIAVLTNTGTAPITLTVKKDGATVGDFVVAAGGTVDAPVPLAEDARATIEVFSGDARVGAVALLRDCETKPTGTLPRTGTSSGQLALLALGLIGLGVLVLAGNRRITAIE